MTNNMSGCELD